MSQGQAAQPDKSKDKKEGEEEEKKEEDSGFDNILQLKNMGMDGE